MSKKQDDEVHTLGFGSDQWPDLMRPSIVEVPTAIRDRHPEKEISAADPQIDLVKSLNQPLSPMTLTTYTDAVSRFTRSATAFIEHLPLLSEARDAYVQAMRTSSELRQVLDSGDEVLRNLMVRLEQMVNDQMVKSAPDKKKPEPFKVGAIKATEDEIGGLKKSV
jgi:hypothetical protein